MLPLYNTAEFPEKQNITGFVLTVLGLIILLLAWPICSGLSMRIEHACYVGAMCIWGLVLVVGACIATFRYDKRTAMRLALLLAALLLSILPIGDSEAVYFTAQTMSLLGLTLLIIGLLRWPMMYLALIAMQGILRVMQKMPIRWFLILLCTIFLGITVFLSWYCHNFLPIVLDSIAQYVHAKFMAQGELYGQSPRLRQFFDMPFMINDGKWYSQYQPLQIFLISLGHRLHAPWFVNPLEGALTLFVTYRLAYRIYGETTARLAALLMLASPFLLFMSSEYMSHAGALLCVSLAMLCYLEALEGRRCGTRYAYALGTGAALGCLFLLRPLPAIGVALALVFYSVLLWRTRRAPLNLFFCMAATALVFLPVQAWYNSQLTGNAFLFPYIKFTVHNWPWFDQRYPLNRALSKSIGELNRMNVMLFECFIPCGFFILIQALNPFRHCHAPLLWTMAGTLILVNLPSGHISDIWGPRYLYETTSCLIILISAGMLRLPILLHAINKSQPTLPAIQGAVAFAIIIIFISGWIYKIPQDMRQYSHRYMQGDPAFYFSLLEQSQKPALIFIKKLPYESWGGKYEYVAFTNPPQLDSPAIFARDLGFENDRQLINNYPDRYIYMERGGKLYPFKF